VSELEAYIREQMEVAAKELIAEWDAHHIYGTCNDTCVYCGKEPKTYLQIGETVLECPIPYRIRNPRISLAVVRKVAEFCRDAVTCVDRIRRA